MISTMVAGALIVLSVIAHELAHGYMALAEGDDTARRAGRLTWNPVKHIDLVTTIVFPLVSLVLTHGAVALGGAKPVPVSPRRYRDGAASDVRVSLAGVAANAALALLCAMLGIVVPPGSVLGSVFERVAFANVALVVFNLLPIAPLDGWRVWRIAREARRRRRAIERSPALAE